MKLSARNAAAGLVAVLVVAAIVSFAGLASSPHDVDPVPTTVPTGAERAEVVRVIDGDTITVRLEGAGEGAQVVRLVGVDTPETVDPNRPVGCFGADASTFTHTELDGHTVYLEVDQVQGDTDKYGRLLRYVWIPGTDAAAPAELFNATLLEDGYGVAYRGDQDRKQAFDALEREAKDSRRGLWSACPAA
ncbi:Nuclease (plasmid) [Agreia sp. COWG]|nr:Nuclease [Agreia sp. COWG]